MLPLSPEQEISNATNMTSALRQPQWRDGTLHVGRLSVGPGIVGYGSSGTLVFEGSLDGRNVAVKRILRQVCLPPEGHDRNAHDTLNPRAVM